MPNIFSSRPGVAAVLSSGDMLPFWVHLEAFAETVFARAAFTGASLQLRDGYQEVHSLNEFIYFYAFAPRVTAVTLRGVGFAGGCDGVPVSALDRLYIYYERNRITSRRSPVKLFFGPALTLAGFLVGMDFDANDPSTGLAAFSLLIRALPRPRFIRYDPDYDPQLQGSSGRNFV